MLSHSDTGQIATPLSTPEDRRMSPNCISFGVQVRAGLKMPLPRCKRCGCNGVSGFTERRTRARFHPVESFSDFGLESEVSAKHTTRHNYAPYLDYGRDIMHSTCKPFRSRSTILDVAFCCSYSGQLHSLPTICPMHFLRVLHLVSRFENRFVIMPALHANSTRRQRRETSVRFLQGALSPLVFCRAPAAAHVGPDNTV
jgi:hypothetical protein